MLASAVTELPRGAGWAYEFKWDGVRAALDVSDRGMTLRSRNGNDVTDAYPELMALADGVGDALFDGEIVAFVDGRPSFEALQRRMHVRGSSAVARLAAEIPVTFVAFDLLRRYGVELIERAYVERRATLEKWADDRPQWTVSPYFDDGPATEAAARRHGLEGVVAKRLTSLYRPGTRSPDWQKLRFLRTGDFVVIGWEAAADRPKDLTSLLLGYYVDGTIAFAGKVGSGLDGRTTTILTEQLTPAGCPVDPEPPTGPGRVARWVRPEVVVEVQFHAWTDDGRLRHPVLHRLRPDKAAIEAAGDG